MTLYAVVSLFNTLIKHNLKYQITDLFCIMSAYLYLKQPCCVAGCCE